MVDACWLIGGNDNFQSCERNPDATAIMKTIRAKTLLVGFFTN